MHFRLLIKTIFSAAHRSMCEAERATAKRIQQNFSNTHEWREREKEREKRNSNRFQSYSNYIEIYENRNWNQISGELCKSWLIIEFWIWHISFFTLFFQRTRGHTHSRSG